VKHLHFQITLFLSNNWGKSKIKRRFGHTPYIHYLQKIKDFIPNPYNKIHYTTLHQPSPHSVSLHTGYCVNADAKGVDGNLKGQKFL